MNKSDKCSVTQVGRIVIHKDDSEKRIYREELDLYINNGWSIGVSDKHRRTQAKVHVGQIPYNKGIAQDDLTKQKISNSLKGNIPWNKGKRGYTVPKDVLEKKLEKEHKTKRKNNSFNASKPELEYLEKLRLENPGKTIIHQYKDKQRYPFYCDFYIVEDDLFIEFNQHWTHGGRPYDPNDDECRLILEKWQNKAKQSQYYAIAISTWTDRDVRKRECAIKNNLNYRVIY